MTATCKTCGTEFTATRKWQQYCTPRCRHNSPTKAATTRSFQVKRREMIDRIKVETGCVECGYNAHPAALDFNHVRGTKLFNISQDTKKSWELIVDEIAKCNVLCANCHRIHTHEERHWQTKRGDRVDV